jgi:hypothetical protein
MIRPFRLQGPLLLLVLLLAISAGPHVKVRATSRVLPIETPGVDVPLVTFDSATSALFVQSAPVMASVEGDAPACNKSIDGWSTVDGATFVAGADTGICTNTDLDAFTVGGEQYVIVAGGEEAAFTILKYVPTLNLQIVTQVTWSLPYTYAADVKAFRQGHDTYAALFLERRTPTSGCGVVIVNITQPETVGPESVVSQTTGADWCDVHNGFVESIDGDARYVYLTANATRDLRVLDIQDVTEPTEIASYRHPNAGNQVFVHDVTVIDHGGDVGRRVYVSYWSAGVMVLDAEELTTSGTAVPLNPLYSIAPQGIRVHHALPDASGRYLFIQDEYPLGLTAPGANADEPVQMWDIGTASAPAYIDGIDTGSVLMPLVNQAHNLELPYEVDLDGNGAFGDDVLFVGWYRGGLRAFRFDASGFTGELLHHQAQTEPGDAPYEGSWGARVVELDGAHYVFHADRRFGLLVDAVGEDPDADAVENIGDNCYLTANASQADADSDLLGDACETDSGTDPVVADTDGDACADGREVRRLTFTPAQGGWRDPLNALDFPDLDDDAVITVLDLSMESQSFLQPPDSVTADLDGDGLVTIVDISVMSGQFLHSCV